MVLNSKVITKHSSPTMELVSPIRRNASFITKLSRFIIYFLLACALGYQVYQLNDKLKIFSTESSIQSTEIPFPGVTVCPPFVMERKTFNAENLRQINITEDELVYALLPTCQNPNRRSKYMTDVKLVDILLKISPDFEDSVYECRINDFSMFFQDCEKLLVKSVTDYGICYTFNMLGHNLVFNQEISSDFDTFKRTKIGISWNLHEMNDTRYGNDTEPQTWSLDTGYINEDEHIQPVRASKLTTFLLKTKSTHDKSLCADRDRNYKMILHLPNELPQITYEAIDIPLEKEQSVMITAEVTGIEESMWDLSPKTRGCYLEGEKQLKFFKSYTKANCEYECMTNFVNLTCGCVKFSMPRTKDMKVCMYYNYGCVNNIVKIFPRSYYMDSENKKNFPDYPCGCLPSCTEIKYKVIKVDRKDLAEG